MGRNIWQSDHPVAMIKAVRALVHENFNVKESYELLVKEKERDKEVQQQQQQQGFMK
jgi:putative autoinducer-2 (AI-2) aldolase